ncbi:MULTISPECIES: hypothetical protein [unclassified Bradyrhizobium]|uniref:hypothetical protein n=1 Tax=unclassified Bradyrhizobium TaxID=2631580 RepID=UPI001FF32437|nr:MULTISPECIES: hypothetical protein [unclassified Bradyrhizobium]MCJ9699816.1 hypothetical protein [Bradyrhizobium sp. SHOUNA76]MCJ9729242.1 hypothetical protein [Bradyrhizobium sp. PRIMUS42]
MSFVVGLFAAVMFALLAPALQLMARARGWTLGAVMLLAIAAIVTHGLGVMLGIFVVTQFQYWDAASIFGFCVMGYVFAFGAVYKSVSLDILLSVIHRPERRAPLSDIVERQVPALFQGRIGNLVDSGLVEPVDSHFAATAAGRTLAGRVGQLRRAFGIGDTSLYDFSD